MRRYTWLLTAANTFQQTRYFVKAVVVGALGASTDEPLFAHRAGSPNSLTTAARNLAMKKRTKNESTEGKMAVITKRALPKEPRAIPGKIILKLNHH